MALIGNWGDFTFYVSADQIKTFDSLKWDSAAKYSTHDRHLREPLLEFTGTDVETITFTMWNPCDRLRNTTDCGGGHGGKENQYYGPCCG